MGLRTLQAANKLCHTMLAFISLLGRNPSVVYYAFPRPQNQDSIFFNKMKMGSVYFFLKIGATDSTQKRSILASGNFILSVTFKISAFIYSFTIFTT